MGGEIQGHGGGFSIQSLLRQPWNVDESGRDVYAFPVQVIHELVEDQVAAEGPGRVGDEGRDPGLL